MLLRIQVEEDPACMKRVARCNHNLQVLVARGDQLWNTSVDLGLKQNNLQNKQLQLEWEADNLRHQLKYGVPSKHRGRPILCAWPG
jgi:hypothetical protein